MFGLGNLLFGKKVKVNTQLGTFKARVKKDSSKEIVWTRDFTSNATTKELFLLLLGNGKGPYESQIEAVQFILNNPDEIKDQIVTIITNDKSLQSKFQGKKIADFHLVYIGVLRESKVNYELSFETKNNEEYVGAIFKDQKITEVSL